MSNKANSTHDSFSTLIDNWLDMQREYWNLEKNAADNSTKTDSTTDTPNNCWNEAFAKWRQAASSSIPPDGHETYERLIDLGRSYFAFGQQLISSSRQENISHLIDEWLNQINGALTTMTQNEIASDPKYQNTIASWNIFRDQWQKIASLAPISPFISELLRTSKGKEAEHIFHEANEYLAKLHSVPGVGYYREIQEQFQRLDKLLVEHHKTYEEFNVALAHVGIRAIDRFRKKLDATMEGPPVDSLRKLYDLWIDANEEVYGAYIASDEYAMLYGRLSNAFLAIKFQSDRLMDRRLDLLNLPTRGELDSIHRRFQQIRREIRLQQTERTKTKRRVKITKRKTIISTKKKTTDGNRGIKKRKRKLPKST